MQDVQETRGMAPTPAQMNALKLAGAQKPTPVTKKKKGKESQKGVSLKSDSSPTGVRSQVNQILESVHWQYQKRVLDMAQIVCEESKWVLVRQKLMDIMTEQVNTTHTLVSQRIADFLADLEDAGFQEVQDSKEIGNGNESA